MIIKAVVVGGIETNCYIVGDERTKEAFIIDPGGDPEKIKKILRDSGLEPQVVINTHGHGDHISADSEFGLPIWIHTLDAECLSDPSRNLSASMGHLLKVGAASRFLEEGDILNIGRYSLEVIHTPGHTPGSICLKGEGVIFTGDTLFCDGIGRTDLPYGSERDIIRSISNRLFTLDDSYVIYPGHGPSSTIGEEKATSPFMS